VIVYGTDGRTDGRSRQNWRP